MQSVYYFKNYNITGISIYPIEEEECLDLDKLQPAEDAMMMKTATTDDMTGVEEIHSEETENICQYHFKK